MQYKMLGKTGLRVSALGFGASPLGNEFGSADPEEGRRAVHRAIDLGINYFDVAPYYGRALAETRLGEALAGHRQDIILATKAGRYGQDLETGFDFSRERITRSIEESLIRLQTDYIDVYQVHDIEFGDRVQIIEETLPAMQCLKDRGLVRFIGITGYPLQMLREVAEAFPVDTVLSYCRYTLLDRTLDQVLLPFARRQQIGLINASPLHMRLLTQRGAPEWHPAPRAMRQAAQRAAAYAAEQGVDLAELALQFALSHPYVATTLVGMSKVHHVEQNTAAVGVEPPRDVVASVLDILAPVANRPWRSGRPENDDSGAVEEQI